MALSTGKKWKNGRTLQVGFMNGHREVQAKVKAYAQQWSQFANIRLDFVSGPDAEVRISFQPGDGSWSYIGTDTL